MRTKDLYEYAQKHGIQVECARLPENKSFSICTPCGNCYIAIDPLALKNEADERERMAHELGHCATGSFYNRYSPLDVKAQHEERADRWAIRALVSEEELLEALRSGIRERWELAEYFNVPEPLIVRLLDYYQTRGTLSFPVIQSPQQEH